MRSLRPSRPSVSRGVPGMVTLVAALVLAGCSGGGDDNGGPPRLTPRPQYDVAAAMIDSRPAPEERLNACELLDLTTAEVIELTGADMPEVEPTGSGDLGLICTYGGPGSPERAAGEDDDEDPVTGNGADSETDSETGSGTDAEPDAETGAGTGTGTGGQPDAETGAGTGAGTGAATGTNSGLADATTGAATVTDSTAWGVESDLIPDTFAAGVVVPEVGAEAALAGQPQMLGARYACSEVRGAQAPDVPDAPAAADGAPAPVQPALPTAYIDCIAAPTGGGVEVHTILVVNDQMWHITLLRPEIPRTPEAESEALAGLHRVAEHLLDQA